jgi:nitrite reductase/ring-hydroxylating ferredoxin subunit
MKVYLGKTSEVTPESGKTFVVQGKRILVINDRGVFRAFVNVCPHMGGVCRFDGAKVYCSWHGATFHKETGVAHDEITAGAGLECLQLIVDGEMMHVELSEKAKSPWADDF